ncbi:MAG: low molecular weight phosphotyrosine protein phosphatase [Prevotellaceae bacterium]|nr:low molecular weight phosphotyrosine protein phosphatase [Prevotellaceae bacterium]
MTSILFVCLGNICRSCAAETIMQRLVREAGLSGQFEIDSAGLIDCHQGEPADHRMRRHAARRGLRITHLSRPITAHDFLSFDLIVGMDDNNLRCLRALAPSKAAREKIRLMSDYCLTHKAASVPDPYYGGSEDFEYALDLLEDACQGLLDACLKQELRNHP